MTDAFLSRRRVVHAPLVADGAGTRCAPGALVLEGCRVIAVGAPEEVGPVSGATPEVLPRSAIVPALVNAHTHLDLTSVGCQPFEGNFDAWLERVRVHRIAATPENVDLSVQQGVTSLLAGGVSAAGDIAGRFATGPSLQRLRAAGITGVVFTELFGMGTHQAAALDAIASARSAVPAGAEDGAAAGPPGGDGLPAARQGLQPHAPYSAGAGVFRAALASGLPVATHLAESADEAQFLRDGTGRFRSLLERAGRWCDTLAFGTRHPVDWAAAVLRDVPGARMVCVHCNEVDDAALALLATLPVVVVFCPRASAYFGHRGHRYREMLSLGMTVALGTDSMLCLDTPDRLSTLDEVRVLMRRDGIDLTMALAMATTHGAAALGLPPEAFTLVPGVAPKAGVLHVPLGPGAGGGVEGGGAPISAVVSAFAAAYTAPVWLAAPAKLSEVLPSRV